MVIVSVGETKNNVDQKVVVSGEKANVNLW